MESAFAERHEAALALLAAEHARAVADHDVQVTTLQSQHVEKSGEIAELRNYVTKLSVQMGVVESTAQQQEHSASVQLQSLQDDLARMLMQKDGLQSAFDRALHDHRDAAGASKSELHEHEAELVKKSEEVEELSAVVGGLTSAMTEIRREAAARVANISLELEAVKAVIAADHAVVAADHAKAMALLAEEHDSSLTAKSAAHAERLQEMAASEAAVAKRHEAARASLLAEHEEAVDGLTAALEEARVVAMAQRAGVTQTEHESAASQNLLSVLVTKHEAATSAAVQKHLQELVELSAERERDAATHQAAVAALNCEHEQHVSELEESRAEVLATADEMVADAQQEVAQKKQLLSEMSELSEAMVDDLSRLAADVAERDAAIAQQKVLHDASSADDSAVSAAHAQALAEMESRHDTTIARVASEHQDAVAALSSEHTVAVSDLVAQASAEKDALVAEHRELLEQGLSDRSGEEEERLQALRDEHAAALLAAKSEHDQQITELKEAHAAVLAAADAKLAEAHARVEQKQMLLADMHKLTDTVMSELEDLHAARPNAATSAPLPATPPPLAAPTGRHPRTPTLASPILEMASGWQDAVKSTSPGPEWRPSDRVSGILAGGGSPDSDQLALGELGRVRAVRRQFEAELEEQQAAAQALRAEIVALLDGSGAESPWLLVGSKLPNHD